MSRLHIAPEMMPVESRTILCVNISGVSTKLRKQARQRKKAFPTR